jgi:hypothetical protein
MSDAQVNRQDIYGIKAVDFQTHRELCPGTCLQNIFFAFKMQCFAICTGCSI